MANILVADPRNMSTYHGLVTKVEKRFSQGLQFLFSYTFGKSLDYGGTAASGGGAVGNPQTVTDIKAGRGSRGYDDSFRSSELFHAANFHRRSTPVDFLPTKPRQQFKTAALPDLL